MLKTLPNLSLEIRYSVFLNFKTKFIYIFIDIN